MSNTILKYNGNSMILHLDTQHNKPTNQKSLKVPKVVKPKNKKMFFYKTLETSPLSL